MLDELYKKAVAYKENHIGSVIKRAYTVNRTPAGYYVFTDEENYKSFLICEKYGTNTF